MIYKNSLAEIRLSDGERIIRYFAVGKKTIQQVANVSVPTSPYALSWDRLPIADARAQIASAKRMGLEVEGTL